MENQEKTKTEKTNSEDEVHIDLNELAKTILNALKVTEIVESNNKVKSEKISADTKINDTNVRLWNKKFTKDIIITLSILITVVTLSFLKVIEGSIVGTLLGSVIGYSIGNGFNKGKD